MGVQLARIEATLERLVKTIEETSGPDTMSRDPTGTETLDHPVAAAASDDRARIAATWAQAIARRDRLFGRDLFSDPAWSILLDLYLANRRRSDLCISSVCRSSQIAMTTALRWLQVLQELQLLERHVDPFDKRRVLLRLTQLGVSKVEEALDLAIDSGRQNKLADVYATHRT